MLEAKAARAPMSWSRNDLSYKDWAKQLWSAIAWQPLTANQASVDSAEDWLVIGGGDVTSAATKAALPKATSAGLARLASSAEVEKLLSERTWQVVVFAEPLVAEDPRLDGPTLAALLRLVQALSQDKRSVKLVLMSLGAQSASGSAIGRGLLGASCWGFMRSVRLEVPHLQLRTVDFAVDADLPDLLPTELAAAAEWPADEEKAAEVSEIAYIQGERCTPRLKLTPVPPGTQNLEAEGSHMISGGFGGLGLSIAQELVDMGAKHLLLVSRSGRVSNDEKLQQMFAELQASPATVHAWSCDVADAAKTRDMLKKTKSLDVPLQSVVHAAGIIDFCELGNLTTESMNAVFKPKVLGAWNLHSEIASGDALAAFVLFSSVSSLVGLPGPRLPADMLRPCEHN